jgi:hypothetical protein
MNAPRTSILAAEQAAPVDPSWVLWLPLLGALLSGLRSLS